MRKSNNNNYNDQKYRHENPFNCFKCHNEMDGHFGIHDAFIAFEWAKFRLLVGNHKSVWCRGVLFGLYIHGFAFDVVELSTIYAISSVCEWIMNSFRYLFGRKIPFPLSIYSHSLPILSLSFNSVCFDSFVDFCFVCSNPVGKRGFHEKLNRWKSSVRNIVAYRTPIMAYDIKKI